MATEEAPSVSDSVKFLLALKEAVKTADRPRPRPA
jgi:hypothetical protein